jgi:hypothetical protein
VGGDVSRVLDGQLSALDLLEPIAAPAPAPKISPHQPCEACGEVEFMQHIMPRDSEKFGHPVCQSMNLTLNHISYSMGQGYIQPGAQPYPCCHDKHGIHGKKIGKPTREHWLDHVRVDIERAKVKWKLHLPSLIGAVGELRVRYGVTPDEAPVVTEDQFIVYLSSVFPEHPCGYCGKEITMNTNNGGGAETLPDGRHARWFICDKCNTKHGIPDLATHPNLKVNP